LIVRALLLTKGRTYSALAKAAKKEIRLLGYHDMGVKKKTFERLRDFRAGVEGNIYELKHA